MKLSSQWKILLVYLGAFIPFFAKGYLLLDPDLGWHLRMGKIILSSGISKTDPLSYTMSSFSFIDHEWLTNVFLYLIYPYGGLITLSIIFSLMVIVILWSIFGKLDRLGSRGSFLLTAATLINFFGVRTQVLSWVFVTILLKVLLNEKTWARFKIFLPILLFLWTNLHGSFAIGVAFLILFGIIRFFQRKLVLSDVLIIFLSVGATFINPYQYRIWEEVFRQFFDTNLKNEITEWGPGIFFGDIPFWTILFLTFSLIIYDLKFKLINHWFTIRKLTNQEKTTFIFFLCLVYAGLSTYRHIPFLVILSGQILVVYMENFLNEFKNDKFALKTIPKVVKFATGLAAIAFLLEALINPYVASKYTEDYFYPKDALKYLAANLPVGQIFSTYGWGGYLDWNLPEKKVFIDGRMPSWKWRAPAGESNWALADQTAIVNGRNIDQYFHKYNIDTVLWPISKKPNILTRYQLQLFNYIDSALQIPTLDPSTTFASRLEMKGWKVVYQDGNAIILQKNQRD